MITRALNIGDKVWMARWGQREERIVCPVCYGRLAVVLTLGNGDNVALACDFCGHGLEPPCGTIPDWHDNPEAELIEITSRNMRDDNGTEKWSYHFKVHFCVDSEDLFDSEADAMAYAVEKTAEQTESNWRRMETRKNGGYRSYAWNAGYHMREAADHRKQAEYHDARAVVCKDRSRKA